MKIFYATATSNVLRYRYFYKQLMDYIKSLGIKFTRDWIQECLDRIDKRNLHLTDRTWKDIYKRLKHDIFRADAIIVDVTMPSTGTGFILGLAFARNIPILLLLPDKKFEAFSKGIISAIDSPFIVKRVVKTKGDYQKYVKEFLSQFKTDKATKKYPLRLSFSEYIKLKKQADSQHTSINNLIRKMVREYE